MIKDNNLNFLRLIFALLVLVSHSFTICFLNEPIVGKGYGIGSMGTLGVYGFFVISGFLMVNSYNRYNNIGIFLWHRFLRIYPALIVAVVFSAILMFFTQQQVDFIDYIQLESFWKFIFGNASLLNIGYNSIDYVLLGVNNHNVIDGPLWTLPIEVRMYLFVAIIGTLGLLKNKQYFNIFLIVVVLADYQSLYNLILYKIIEPSPMQALNPVLYFFMGMFYALNNIKLSAVFFVFALSSAVVSVAIVIPLSLQIISISYCCYFLAFRLNMFRNLFNHKIGDYSYGIYIYTFPIQQFLYYVLKKNFAIELNVIQLIIVSLLIILPISILSWHLLEKKMLAYKNLFDKNIKV